MKTRKARLMVLALTLSGATACNAGSAPSDPDAPPAGCQRTFCDFKHDYCQNPTTPDYCGECFDECSGAIYSNPDCASECQSLCEDQTSQAPSDPCGDALTACRKSSDNAICVDDIGTPAPDGTPCNDTASSVVCKCNAENDSACADAIYTANPACKQCDDGWVSACQSGACPNERSAATACFTQNGCASSYCGPCTSEMTAWNACLNAAQDDPSDPGGCNTGSHKCWTQPFCNPDGTSGP
jgi:hypothetical protein